MVEEKPMTGCMREREGEQKQGKAGMYGAKHGMRAIMRAEVKE